MHSKIETLSKTALHEVQVALTGLVGSDISLSLISSQLQKKDIFLHQHRGANTYIGLEVRGSYTGDGWLIISTVGALRLCGRMLMLPPEDINQLVAAGDFEEETEFAFEDIVRTIIASYVRTFQDPGGAVSSIIYKKKQSLDGSFKECELDNPRGDQAYYQMSADVIMDGLKIGGFSILLPAFVLLYNSLFKNGIARSAGFAHLIESEEKPETAVSRSQEPRLAFAGLKQKDYRFEDLVSPAVSEAARELSRLLEAVVSIEIVNQGFLDAETMYLNMQNTAHLCARFLLAEPLEEEIMVVAEPGHAVWLGALLAEGVHGAVLARLQDAPLEADYQDGFAEICGVLMDFVIDAAGAESKYHIGVAQKRAEVHTPGEETPFLSRHGPGRDYYAATLKLSVGVLGNGDLHLLIPAALVDLLPPSGAEQLEPVGEVSETVGTDAPETDVRESAEEADQDQLFEANVLVIEGETGAGRMIQAQLGRDRVSSDVVASAAEINRATLKPYSAVILVVERLNETALGLAIKIVSAGSVPLIVAASQWTESEVLKAIRFGVSDILMTPARPGEVVEKLKNIGGGIAA